MRRSKYRSALLIFGAILILASAACGDEYATATDDTHVCVYDGSERGGQRLKFQIAPGNDSKKIDDNDQVVRIPASNRFWMVSSDRSIADPGTPSNYTGNDRNGVPIFIEGQIRFRFNLERACDWYSLHGRRNADDSGSLGFNARGDANAGWFRFGNENFVVTMQEIVSEMGANFDAEALHYNWPEDYDPTSELPVTSASGRPSRQVLGEVLGHAYTARLIENLGGDYFCGISTATAENPCPEITFQVRYAGPGNDSPLVRAREAEEEARRNLEAEAAENALEQEQLAGQIAAEQARQSLLREQQITAGIQATIDFARCAPYAAAGLDCEGHFAQNVFPGG